jgi:putative membrane protein
MSRRALHRTSIAALAAAALISGCGTKDKAQDSARIADSVAAAAAASAPAATTPPPAPTLTDANIFAILDEANASDSSRGAIAATKGTHADVKAFGKTMTRDHHQMRKAGLDLAKKLNVTPDLPAGDNSVANDKAWQDSLNAMPKGADWDKAYIGREVTYHEAVLATAQTALAAAQNPQLKDLITKAAPTVQAHLDLAKSIQTKIATP